MENVVDALQHRIAKIEDRTAKIEDQIQEILGQNGPVPDIGVGSLRIPEDELRRTSQFLGPTSHFRQASSILHAAVPPTPTYPLVFCFLPPYAQTEFATAVRETAVTLLCTILQEVKERFDHFELGFQFISDRKQNRKAIGILHSRTEGSYLGVVHDLREIMHNANSVQRLINRQGDDGDYSNYNIVLMCFTKDRDRITNDEQWMNDQWPTTNRLHFRAF